jgi:hypothetical protein
MIFGLFTLFVALVISCVAAYYSIVGLTAIFSAALIPIIIMGASLEIGKVTAAVWLKLNWDRAKITYKLYLVPAVAFLMLLTSMGIFGFLSKAHSDQSLVSGDVQGKIAIYDEKIKTARENIESDRKQLKQMDEAVDQVMVRSSDEKGADKANSIRKSQSRDRNTLAKDIETNQKLIATLNDESAPIRSEVRKVEAEVGPIKYIAALLYSDNPDTSILEKAVRFVIIIIVAVFDPLALVLILAAQQSLRWAKEDKETEQQEKISEEEFKRELENDPELQEFFDRGRTIARALDNGEPIPGAVIEELPDDKTVDIAETFSSIEEDNKLVEQANNAIAEIEPMEPLTVQETDPDLLPPDQQDQELSYADVQAIWDKFGPKDEPIAEDPTSVVDIVDGKQDEIHKSVKRIQESDYIEVAGKKMHADIFALEHPELAVKIGLRADNTAQIDTSTTFGSQFPNSAAKGDMFLRVDIIPNKLFKFNGFKWIEVDKELTDSYTYDKQYINFLIDKLTSGEYELDQLSATEQELVAEELKRLGTDDHT